MQGFYLLAFWAGIISQGIDCGLDASNGRLVQMGKLFQKVLLHGLTGKAY